MAIEPNKLRLCCFLALVWLVAFVSYGTTLDAASPKNFGRINFGFSEPTRVKANVSGTTATLQFTQPVTQSPAAIKAALPGYVSAVSLSADKRTVTLSMSKAYRLRQFVSGNAVGVDIIGEAGPVAATVPAKAEPTKLAEVKKPAVPKAGEAKKEPKKEAKKDTKTPKREAAKEKPKSSAPTKSQPADAVALAAAKIVPASGAATAEYPLLTTKHTAEKPVEKPAEKAADHATASTEKSAEHAAAPVEKFGAHTASPTEKPAESTPAHAEKPTDHAATSPAPKPAPSAPLASASEDMLSTKHPPAEPTATAKPATEAAITTTKEPTASAVKETPSKTATTKAAASPAKPTSTTISAKTENGTTSIHFPWAERTGAAIFRRGQDIWLVFSSAKNANAGMLSTQMPKQVINVMQYNYPGNTVLRLITDGTLYARAEQPQGSYDWDVVLGGTPTAPELEVNATVDMLEGTARLILSAYDVTSQVRFFDPTIGDELIIIPANEKGRGVSSEHNYPEMTLLNTTQGIALVTNRHEITTSQTRTGLIVSSKNGLALSENLPLVKGSVPVTGATRNSGILMPFDQWYIPLDRFRDTEIERLHAVAAADKASKADALFGLVKLYMAQGMATESLGVLGLIHGQFPEYYTTNKLALISAAAHVMINHIEDAGKDLLAPELVELDEAAPWREVVALLSPAPNTVQQITDSAHPSDAVAAAAAAAAAPEAGGEHATEETTAPEAAPPAAAPITVVNRPVFHFLKYNKLYIRYYPPRIRQRLAVIAADAYIADGQEEKALAVFDTLLKDSISDPVQQEAEYALAATAAKKGQTDEAYKAYARLMKQTEDRRVATKARYADAMLRFKKSKITAGDAAEILESARVSWRGDAVERQILASLVDLYTATKRYDDVLRTYRAILEEFPGDPETLAISGKMGELFQDVFLNDLADDMPPLKALSLFYEFRDLTPLGETGDKIIQKLADRLAAIDLLDRATQLLENQVKFRVTGAARAQIGARLALLYLLNQQPQEALDILGISNYGDIAPELKLRRQQLTAEALMKTGKNEEALVIISADTTHTGALLRLEILWAMKDWPNVVNHAEDILGARANLTDPLTNEETAVLLKLALAYAFESDYVQLRYLRDYYSGLIPSSGYKQIFDYITNDTAPLDAEDFAMLASQISHTESFLDQFKSKIAAGKLSEAME